MESGSILGLPPEVQTEFIGLFGCWFLDDVDALWWRWLFAESVGIFITFFDFDIDLILGGLVLW
jgi:hypothetical protein